MTEFLTQKSKKLNNWHAFCI